MWLFLYKQIIHNKGMYQNIETPSLIPLTFSFNVNIVGTTTAGDIADRRYLITKNVQQFETSHQILPCS